MSTKVLDRPVIVVSAGRSGSSVFHDILSLHPEVCWLPQGCGDRPEQLGRFRPVFRFADFPAVGDLLRRRFQPVEGYEFWDHHFPGFSRTCRDLVAADVTPPVKSSIRSALAELPSDRRNRLVLKVTGWPRVGFLSSVLANAKFIHVVRDGRSVAASLLRVPWWKGWEGPANWRLGPLSSRERAIWDRHDQSFIALAGIEWVRIMDAMEKSRSMVEPEDWLTVRYEDLCRNPTRALDEVLDFAELESTTSYLQLVENFGLESRNPKWKKHLEGHQQAVLEDVLSRKLDEYGYA